MLRSARAGRSLLCVSARSASPSRRSLRRADWSIACSASHSLPVFIDIRLSAHRDPRPSMVAFYCPSEPLVLRDLASRLFFSFAYEILPLELRESPRRACGFEILGLSLAGRDQLTRGSFVAS